MFRKEISLLLLVVLLFQGCFALNVTQQKKRKVNGCLTHIVNIGEDLPSIMIRYEILAEDLKIYNPAIEHDLKPGEYIYIPKKLIGDAPQDELRRDIEAVRAEKQGEIEANKPKEDITPVDEPTTELIYNKHIVTAGETFYSISKLYDLTVAQLQSHNENVIQNAISVGTALNIPIKIIGEEGATSDRGVYDEYNQISFDPGSDRINISLILPLKGENGIQSDNFAQFYQGFLVGVDSLRNEGVNISLNVLNSDKQNIVSDRIIRSGELDGSDIIIGPVYDEQFCKVAEYAADNSIPIVSPLAKVSCESKFAFQVSPDDITRYDKLKNALTDKNIILLSTENDDSTFVAAMDSLCNGSIKVVPFNIKSAPRSYIHHLSNTRANVFLIATTDPQEADGVISKVGAIRVFAGASVVSSISTAKIARMSNIDPSILYNANLSYVTSYHNDRTSKIVREFDSKYMTLFGDIPSLYSYRGYDVALFFVGSLKEFGEEFSYYIENYSTTTLQVAYRFNRNSNGGKFVNQEWMLINYTPTYEIIVK